MKTPNTDTALDLANERIAYLESLVKKYKFCALTDLMKDQDFDDKFHRVFEEYQFAETSFTLVIADINYLHNVNKLEGWKAGNNLIEGVATQLKDIFALHQIYRIGGDEFCMVVRESSKTFEEIEEVMQTVDNVTFKCTKSNGYVNPSQMFKETDAELNKIKLARPNLEERV